jgi:hypothetical protein
VWLGGGGGGVSLIWGPDMSEAITQTHGSNT